MKNYFFAILLLGLAVVSCDKDFDVDDNVSKLEESKVVEYNLSDYEVTLTGDAIMMVPAEEVESVQQKLNKKANKK